MFWNNKILLAKNDKFCCSKTVKFAASEQDFVALKQHNFVAIGEVGIDLYWDKSFFEQQKHAFKLQINFGEKHNLPIIIHSRNSFNDVFKIIHDEKSSQMTGVFHCFSGTYEEA